MGWATWLAHGDEGWVGIGLLVEIFFPWSRWEGWLVPSAERKTWVWDVSPGISLAIKCYASRL